MSADARQQKESDVLWKTPIELMKMMRAGTSPDPPREKSTKLRTLRTFESNEETATLKFTRQPESDVVGIKENQILNRDVPLWIMWVTEVCI